MSNGTNYVAYNCSTSIETNTWIHIAAIYKDKTLKLYINGDLKKSYTTTYDISFNSITSFGVGAAPNGAEKLTGYLNDVRIYDHALSPFEVKQISQGLILHYPLNRKGWGQENLVNNSDFSNLATTGTVIRDETVLFHGHPTCKISRTGATSNTYTGWSSQNLLSRLTPGTKVTASVWVYRESTHEIDSGCEWRMYQRYNNGASTDWTGFYFASDWPIGEWKRFTHTYTVRSDISGAFLNFNVVKNGTYWLAEPKVEIGEKATNWSPSVTDALSTIMGLNETIEYDCSGYCNNGTRIGTFSWTSDTPKYSVSTAFEKGIISIPNSFVTTVDPVFSISLWFKLKSGITYTAYTDLISFSSSSYSNQPFRLELCGTPVGKTIMWFRGPSGQSGGFAVKSDISTDEWYHTVLVSEGNKQYSYYINGEKLGTYNGSANSWTPTGNVSLGENINGVFYESDFRVYATALSAEDVKSLYQNSAYIDNQGNIYGAIYEEV